MANIDTILSRLESVRQTGANRWVARCPAHVDRSPSLAIRELDDGRILLHDFGGCETHDVLAAIGLDLSDLFPDGPREHHCPPERRPWPAADVLRCLGFEALVIANASRTLLNGQPPIEADHERLILAAERFQSALTEAGVNYAY